jgi:cysteine desulfurase
MPRVYLDHHAATPISALAQAAMREAAEQAWANPASVHSEGRASRAHLERARGRIAQAIGAQPADLVLTGGGTEACNLAVWGALTLDVQRAAGASLLAITTAGQHPAVSEPLRQQRAQSGFELRELAVPRGRPPDLQSLSAALQARPRLLLLQWVNHETGTLFPIESYAELAWAAGVPVFVDATQALGKLPIDVATLQIDMLALASQKLGGPPGAGALWVRRGFELEPLLSGGGQERGRRAGTPDVIAQAGFGAACTQCDERVAAQSGIARLRDAFEGELCALGAIRNAPDGPRSASVSNLYFPGRRAEALVAAFDLEGVALSAGAACSSGKSEPSPVLLAMHPDETSRAESSIRFSFGTETTEIDLDFCVAACRKILARPAA